jgi:hypothetical protein
MAETFERRWIRFFPSRHYPLLGIDYRGPSRGEKLICRFSSFVSFCWVVKGGALERLVFGSVYAQRLRPEMMFMAVRFLCPFSSSNLEDRVFFAFGTKGLAWRASVPWTLDTGWKPMLQ